MAITAFGLGRPTHIMAQRIDKVNPFYTVIIPFIAVIAFILVFVLIFASLPFTGERLLYKVGESPTCGSAPQLLTGGYMTTFKFYNHYGTILNDCEITPNAAVVFIYKNETGVHPPFSGTIHGTITTSDIESGGVIDVMVANDSSPTPTTGDFCVRIANIASGSQQHRFTCNVVNNQFVILEVHPDSLTNIILRAIEILGKSA